jgi:hypothetical protein
MRAKAVGLPVSRREAVRTSGTWNIKTALERVILAALEQTFLDRATLVVVVFAVLYFGGHILAFALRKM